MSALLEQLEYGYDRDSRRTWRRRALTTGQDGLSQVVNAARGNLNLNATAIGGVPAEEESRDYDPTGNWRGYRMEENGAVTLEQQRVHDRGNRLMQGGSLQATTWACPDTLQALMLTQPQWQLTWPLH